MLYIHPTENSPKIVIDFPELLFEVSGHSQLDDPLSFYQPVFTYITDHFYQVVPSIYHRSSPSITLHFYLRHTGMQDLEMIRQLDLMFFNIREFKTYIYWYYNPGKTASAELARDVEKTFLNHTRLITNTVHV